MANETVAKRIKTVPEPVKDHRPVIVTGNDYISLPEIDECGRVMSVTFLHQAHASLFGVRGTAPEPAVTSEVIPTSETTTTPETVTTSDPTGREGRQVSFIRPLLEWDGMQVDLRGVCPKVELKWDWVPSFTWDLPDVSGGPIRLGLRIVAPPDEKGFCYTLELERLGFHSDVDTTAQRTAGLDHTAEVTCTTVNRSMAGANGMTGKSDTAENSGITGVDGTDGRDILAISRIIEPDRQDESGTTKTRAKIGLVCTWGSSIFRVFTSRPIPCTRSCRYDRWTQSVVAEAMGPLPLFGFSLNSSLDFDSIYIEESADDPCRIRVSQDRELAPGDKVTCAYYVAFNREADGARTTGVHLKRVGWKELEERTYAWLRMRRRSFLPQARCISSSKNQDKCSNGCRLENPHEIAGNDELLGNVESVINRNLLFNYFFATGKTLDSESSVAVTSRSPRYYVSAAFWARDVLLWSMPALVLTDAGRARDVLLYSTRIGTRNVGDHALYMDGTALYPGFELDEAAAHIIGLGTYLEATGDCTVLNEPGMPEGIERTLAAIEKWLLRDNSGKPVLCRTFLDPSDDPVEFPFLTYSNVLLWKAWMIASSVFKSLGGDYAHVADELLRDAKALEEAIRRYCVVDGPLGPMYAWAVDLKSIKRDELRSSGGFTCNSSTGDIPAGDNATSRDSACDGSACEDPACNHPTSHSLTRGHRDYGKELISRVNYETYDNPPGSLELIRHYGFPHDEETSKILRNTQRWIRSQHNRYFFDGEFGGPGSAHSPHPWPMAAANTILAEVAEYEACGVCDTRAVKEALRLLTTAPMDGGLVSESIDPVTGIAKTGLALATGAGFVAYALWRGHEICLDLCS
jgi:hypothetical protein